MLGEGIVFKNIIKIYKTRNLNKIPSFIDKIMTKQTSKRIRFWFKLNRPTDKLGGYVLNVK